MFIFNLKNALDYYKQMLIDEMRLFVEENQLVVENEDDAVQK